MGKKEDDQPSKREAAGREMKPSEWAKEDKFDPHLFLWHDQKHGKVSREEFEKMTKGVCR